MAFEALAFLAVTVTVFAVVGFGPTVLLGPEEPGPALLLSPVVGLATLYLACQWLSPYLASSVIVLATLAAGATVSVVVGARRWTVLRTAAARSVGHVLLPAAVAVATYLVLLTHVFKVRLFTLAGTGLDAIFIYAPVAEFMRRHPYTTSGRPALDVPALPTLIANFYPGSLGTVDGGLGALVRRPAFALIEPLNAVCVVLALAGLYVLVTAALGQSRRVALLAVVVMACNQFVFWSAGFDFVQQLRASALFPGALALLLIALRTGRARTGVLAGGVIAASVAIYMPVFLVLLAATGGAVALYMARPGRSWRVVASVAGGGLGLGLPSVGWLVFGGGLHAWDLVSRNLFSPYPAGGMLDTHYDLPYLTGSASVSYLYRDKPLLFWGPAWAGVAWLVALLAVALLVVGLAALVRAGRWPEAGLFLGGLAYLAFVRFGSGNLYGFVKTVSYLVPLTSCLVALGASRVAGAGRAPAMAAATTVGVVLAGQVAATAETQHMLLLTPPTISASQARLRVLPQYLPPHDPVLLQDYSAPVPGLPLSDNSTLYHIVAYFLPDRDVVIAAPLLTPELAARFRYVVRTGILPAPPSPYRLLWQDADLGVSLYGRPWYRPAYRKGRGGGTVGHGRFRRSGPRQRPDRRRPDRRRAGRRGHGRRSRRRGGRRCRPPERAAGVKGVGRRGRSPAQLVHADADGQRPVAVRVAPADRAADRRLLRAHQRLRAVQHLRPRGVRLGTRSMDHDLTDLARRVGEACRLTGTFTLRSGQVSSTYFDKYLFEADPALLAAVAQAAVALIPPGTEVLAGLELGGVPVATALSLATGLPAAFVRKEAKKYGTAKLAEGAGIEGRRVLVVEDIVTTGGQVVLSARDLRERGADLVGVLCMIDRSEGRHQLAAEGLDLVSLFTAADLG